MKHPLLLVFAALAISACDSQGQSTSVGTDDGNTPTDGDGSGTTPVPDGDGATGGDETPSDPVPQPGDGLEVSDPETDVGDAVGVIRGNIFWNQPSLPDGQLFLALSRTSPATEPFALELLIDPAVLPTPFEFDGVPEGSYYVLAFFDVGRDNTWDAPGLEDFVTISSSDVGVSVANPVASNINVELR